MRRPGNHSEAFRAAALAALHRINRTRHLRTKCGARRKRDGEPCETPAMANGRCWQHGGTTPRGDNWHRTKWPDPKGSNPTRKLARKLRDANRAAKARAKRLATMTPEERVKHDRWHRSHRPGSAAERARLRLERAQAADVRKRMMATDDRPVSPELVAVRAELDALERKLATIDAVKGIGVFG